MKLSYYQTNDFRLDLNKSITSQNSILQIFKAKNFLKFLFPSPYLYIYDLGTIKMVLNKVPVNYLRRLIIINYQPPAQLNPSHKKSYFSKF